MEKYKDEDERQKVTETMNLLLSSILPILSSETTITVQRALYLLGEIDVESQECESAKEIYNKGFSDGQKALAEHLKLCKEERQSDDDAMDAYTIDYDNYDIDMYE